jgi:serine/threonine protein phosphatase PrpC
MTCGCTASVVLVTPTEIYIANVGDSRVVLSKEHTAIELTRDHKPSLEDEKERIISAKAFISENRVQGQLAVSRALGDY